jgi:hypothetical protein
MYFHASGFEFGCGLSGLGGGQCGMGGFCVEVGYGAWRHPIGNEVSPLWEWLPAFVAKATSAE